MNDRSESASVWFITGTSSGFGRALVEALADRGDLIFATARDVSTIADLADLRPGRILTARLDLTVPESIKAAVDEAVATLGRIDVLVNNAGYALLGAFEELDEKEFRHSFEANFFGPLAVTRAVLPTFRRQGSGHIIQISSVNGVVAGGTTTAYSSAKFATEGLSEGLSQELEHLGIRVTIVEPGPFRTEFSGRSARWGEPLSDYEEVSVASRRNFEQMHGTQPGDPHRGAEAIIAAMSLPEPPLRLPLGAEAFDWISAHLKYRLDELDETRGIGSNTAIVD